MNICRRIFLLFGLFGFNSFAMTFQDRAIPQCPPPQELLDEIESCLKNNVPLFKAGLSYKDEGIAGFFCKSFDPKRLINAERMREFIVKHNLTCLRVPRKYVVTVKGIPYLFVEKIEPNLRYQEALSLKEVQQLAFLVAETGYRDIGFCTPAGFDNLIRDRNNKLVFIDTEDNSFYLAFAFPYNNLPVNCKQQFLGNLLHGYQHSMNPDAKTWLEKRFQALMKEPVIECVTLAHEDWENSKTTVEKGD